MITFRESQRNNISYLKNEDLLQNKIIQLNQVPLQFLIKFDIYIIFLFIVVGY